MQDEKALVHLASGFPRADETMRAIAPERFWWDSKTHVDFSAQKATVTFYRSLTDSVTVIAGDCPTGAVFREMRSHADILRERLAAIRGHAREQNKLPVERRERTIRFN